MPLGPSQQYLARFNGTTSDYVFPGYVQSESFDSVMNIAQHNGSYIDGSLSEAVGLANKQLSLTLKVWEKDYATCKQQVMNAATIMRSTKNYAPLYVQFTDRYYTALPKSIQVSKQAGTSVKTLEYTLEFDCKPWLESTTLRTLTGSSSISTNSVSRTMANGAWTPCTVTMTGSNIDITGQTANGESTGHIHVVGSVSNLIVNTEAFTATIGGVNANDKLSTVDYRLYVGAGPTTFTITGASSVTITYRDRWYL